jgi:hypothetical protein
VAADRIVSPRSERLPVWGADRRVVNRLGEPLRLEEHLEIVGADGDEPGEQELVEGFGLVVGTARSPLPVDNFTVRLGVEIGR